MKKLLMGGLALVLASAIYANGASIVHIDRAHGQGVTRKGMLRIAEELDLEIRESEQPLTREVLSDVDVLYLRAPNTGFLKVEKKAIIEFVKDGGSLFLGIDEEQRQSLEKAGVNALIHPFGMMFTQDTPYLHNCGGYALEGEIHAARREIPFSGGRSVSGGIAFAYQIDKDGNVGLPHAAYKEIEGGGRIVIMGEIMPTLFMGKKDAERMNGEDRNPRSTIYWGGDSYVFMKEVMAWLANK